MAQQTETLLYKRGNLSLLPRLGWKNQFLKAVLVTSVCVPLLVPAGSLAPYVYCTITAHHFVI